MVLQILLYVVNLVAISVAIYFQNKVSSEVLQRRLQIEVEEEFYEKNQK